MSDSNDRVSIELIDAGEHKDRVVLVLSKVKGLTMSPQQIISNTPCTVATNVPRQAAEKLQEFLEKAGAMVMLEGGEEELFSPEEFPLPEEEAPAEMEEAEPADEFSEPSEEELFSESEEESIVPDFPSPGLPESETEEAELAEEKKVGVFQQLLSRLPQLGRKKEQAEAEAEIEAETEIEKPEKKSPLAFLSKFRKKATEEEPSEETLTEPRESAEGPKKKVPSLMSHPASLIIVGFLVGVVFMGTWGLFTSRSIEKQWEQRIRDFDEQTAKQIKEDGAELKNMVTQLFQENTALKEQITTLTDQLEKIRQPTSIIPSQVPETEMTTWQQELVRSFQELIAVHAQSLENGYEAQKQAGCSQQLLLDGKSTYTYAQVVKKFNSKHMRYEIMKSNSLTAPYIANFKIPFQQEIRTGETEEACNEATLQQLETPDHHEFGGYYGYWEIEYEYKEGKWMVNSTVVEKNRALYESAFQHGSPDYAKFRINTDLFPEFKTP